MKVRIFLVLCAVAFAAQARASEAPVPHRENNPHMGAFKQPIEWERDKIRIEAPAGYPVCSVLESFSSWLMFFIPIDPATPCEKFPLDSDWDKNPDFVVIDPYVDSPMNMDTLEDYIRGQQMFLCEGMQRSPKSDKAWIRSSDAQTVRAPAGKRLLGQETVTCTRTDEKNDRYSKAYVAYKPDPNFVGRGYAVGAYVHIKNKKAADRLLEQVVDLLKPLE